MRCDMQACGPHLVAVDPVSGDAITHFGHGARVDVRCVRAVIFLGQAKGPAHFAGEHLRDEVPLLLFGAKVTQHQHLHEVADDGAFILQIIVKAKALGGQVMPDDSHGEVGAILAAKLLRDGKAIMPGGIGNAIHFAQQLFPLMPGQAVIVPIGPRVFAAVVEEAFIVIARLNGLDLALNEGVEFPEIVGDVLWNFKKHGRSSPMFF